MIRVGLESMKSRAMTCMKDRYLAVSIGAACVISAVLIIIRVHTGNYITTDSQDYYNLTEYMRTLILGGDITRYSFVAEFSPGGANISIIRLFRIAIPLMALPFSFMLGTEFAYFAIDAIFIIASSALVYFTALELGHTNLESFASSLLFSGSYFVLSWGISILVEAGSWFFTAVSIFIAVRIWKEECTSSAAAASLIGVLFGIGVIAKESNIAGLLFVILIILKCERANLSFHKHFSIPFLIAGVLPFALIQISVWWTFGFTYWGYLLSQISSGGAFDLLRTLGNFGWSYFLAFGFMIALSVIGFLEQESSKRWLYGSMLIAYTVPNLLIMNTVFYARFAALTYPFFVLLTPIAISWLIGATRDSTVMFLFMLAVVVGNVFVLKYLVGSGAVFMLEIALGVFSIVSSIVFYHYKRKGVNHANSSVTNAEEHID